MPDWLNAEKPNGPPTTLEVFQLPVVSHLVLRVRHAI